MGWFLLAVLALVSGGMLAWSLRKPGRVFEFPALFGAAWLFYIAFQAAGVLNNPAALPVGAERDNGVELALAMSILSALAGFAGYLTARPRRRAAGPGPVYSWDRLFAAGVVLCGIAWMGFFKLSGLTGGALGYFSTRGNYALTWRGEPVAYVFFVALIYPGLLLCLMAALRRPSPAKAAVVVLAAAYPVARVLFLGRRTDLVILALTFALAFYFTGRWTPPRVAVIAAMAAGAATIFVAPVYRSYSELGADRGRIREIDVAGILRNTWQGAEYSEFQYAAARLAATSRIGEYGYGRLFYNMLVQEWVPRLITGDEFKESLFLPAPNGRGHIYSVYGWQPPFGSNPTGINQAFGEFWFFGALIYFPVGRLYRRLWERAAVGRDAGAMALYASLAPWTMLSVVANLSQIPATMLYFGVFLCPLLRLSRVPSRTARAGAGLRRNLETEPCRIDTYA